MRRNPQKVALRRTRDYTDVEIGCRLLMQVRASGANALVLLSRSHGNGGLSSQGSGCTRFPGFFNLNTVVLFWSMSDRILEPIVLVDPAYAGNVRLLEPIVGSAPRVRGSEKREPKTASRIIAKPNRLVTRILRFRPPFAVPLHQRNQQGRIVTLGPGRNLGNHRALERRVG